MQDIYREEFQIHEVAYNTSRFAIGNQINLKGVGACTVFDILIDTNEKYIGGFTVVKIVLVTEKGEQILWRSLPYDMCILTYDAAAQLGL
jgi:hypothetical protein